MLSIGSGVAGPILVGFVAAGLLACVGELIVVVFLSGSRPAGVAGFAGLGRPVSVTSLGLAIFVLVCLLIFFIFPPVVTLGFVWARVTISSTKVAKSSEGRNSPTVPNFSLLNVSGGWVSVLAMTGCVPIAGPGSTGVFGAAWGTCKEFVRHGVCCGCGGGLVFMVALGAADATVGAAAGTIEAACILLAAAAYDNFSVLAKTPICLALM